MGEAEGQVFRKLIQVSILDGQVASILAERRKIESEFSDRSERLKDLKNEKIQKEYAADTRRKYYEREEGHLREEQERLIERRKALATFNNYKTQQAAEKEIAEASKQLSAREESLIKVADEVDELTLLGKTAQELFEAGEKEFREFEDNAQASLGELENRLQEKTAERESLLQGIDGKALREYERAHERHPMNPLVAVENGVCGGCYMQAGMQTVQRVSRGTELVHCQGCQRILYLPEQVGTLL